MPCYALAGDTIEITDQQDSQQDFRIDRRPASITVEIFQLFADKVKTDVSVDEAQQVVFRNEILNAKVVEERL